MREQPKCRKCGKLLKFVKTKNGRNMPVDSFSVNIRSVASGALYYMDDGTTVRGVLCDRSATGSMQVYEPHWYTCPYSDELRRTPRQPTAEELRARLIRQREKLERQAEERSRKAAERERAERRREAEREETAAAGLAQMCMFAPPGRRMSDDCF